MAESSSIKLRAAKVFHFSQTIQINKKVAQVFAYIDDIHNTGWHMEKSSMPMMGSKMTVETISEQKSGLGATYRWTGKVMGLRIDFTETITRWVKNKERVWQTIGDPQIIIMGNYVMGFFLKPILESTQLTFEIDYELPKPLFWSLVGRLLSPWYSRWCLSNMCNDAKATLELT